MLKETLLAASLALLLAGPALAADSAKRTTIMPNRTPPTDDRDDRSENRGGDRRGDGHDDRGDRDRNRGHDRDHDRGRGHDRDDDRRDWDRNDWRRDDDWRRRGWQYHGWRNDGWRHYRGHDNRHWRHVPPYRYGADFGYRSGYELAWRDWLSHGRYDRHWRRNAFYGYGFGYSYGAGYDAGWRDAAYYYGRGYRPDYWAHDPYGGWYFSFRIDG